MLHLTRTTLIAVGLALVARSAFGHGDVAPQPVNTDALPDVGEEWLSENPYRSMEPEVFAKAIEIGSSGFNQNCARCHGLNVVSGGIAPDLRFLTADLDGDEWFAERFQNGYTQNGITKMPAFGEILGQKAGWAIRSYIETRPDDGALDAFSDRLVAIRDQLKDTSEKLSAGQIAYADIAGEIDAIRAELGEIATKVPTASGAPVADSAASRAAHDLDGTPEGITRAQDTLTVNLSVAH